MQRKNIYNGKKKRKRNIKELLYKIEEKRKDLNHLKDQLLTIRWLQAIEQATMIYDWDTNNIRLAIIKIEEEIKELERQLHGV